VAAKHQFLKGNFTMKRNRRGGFTLIEVLIVVVIMAVLAATIIPQFTDSTEDAKRSQLEFNVHTLRAQIQLYKVQHGGQYPDLVAKPQQLTSKTDADGTVNPTGGAFGPYILDQLPMNPFNNKNMVGTTTATSASPPTPTGANGWVYNQTNGMIWPDADGTASE
jgi:prepilin-type N-terminal cleavage/methylation domain-containing protein